MPRRNRDRHFEDLTSGESEPETESTGMGSSPKEDPAPAPVPKPAKEPQVVPERTETLERFARMIPVPDQHPFVVECQLTTKETKRRTRAEWQKLYDEYRIRPRY